MNWDQLNEIIQRHGGAISTVATDPLIDNPDPVDRRLNPKIENPTPTYRYVLKDGKSFTARASQPSVATGQDSESGGETTFTIVDPGNAVQPLTPADRLPSPAGQLEKLDAQGNLISPGSSTPAAKLRDPSTGAVTDLPDAKSPSEGTLKEFGNQLLNIKADGTYTVVASKPAEGAAVPAKSVVDQGGAKYEYDPSKPEGSRLSKLLDAPPDKTAPTTKEVNGQPFQWDPAAGAWKSAPGLPSATKPATASTATNARFIVFYDEQGNEVSRQENPNYQAPTPQQLTPDTVSQNIPLLKADGTVDWVPNQNRVPVSAAMQELLAQVGVKVNAGELSMADAKEMLTGTVNVMNARSAEQGVARAAAGDILTATQQGATTGASLINQRVQAAQGMLGQVLGMAGQGQRSGNMGGGLMSAPAGLGQQIVGGIQGWTEQLGGGPEVYATAANLVRRADPSNGANPQAQVAYGVLGQMLEKYQQMTGQPHPLVAQQQQQQQQPAAMQQLGPQPQAQPQQQQFQSPPQPQYDPRYQPQMPQQQPGTLLPAGVAGTVPPGDPRFSGTFASPPVAPPPVTITIGG